MKIISLFSGCGGLDLGFERAGFDVIWANEYDNTIHKTYKLNHPKTELNTSDIRELSLNEIPDCDGIIGGPPCQSWSLGGKSLGLEDERGKLILDYIRIVKGKQPKFFIMENVPGIVSHRHLGSFNLFLELFRDAGYKVKYELLNASDFKIPQERIRVFIIGIRKDINVEFSFPTPTTQSPITLSVAIGDIQLKPIAYNEEPVIENSLSLNNHEYYAGPFDDKYMARNRVRGWNELSFTIQAQAKNAPIHPQAPKMSYVSPDKRKFVSGKEYLYRRLSVRECARIQSFPDNFKFVYSNVKDGYKMVGNAVPPRLAYNLALAINKCFSNKTIPERENYYLLVGYVKSETDFDVIRKELVYYLRRGNRQGALLNDQVALPFRWLLLHRKDEKELYELLPSDPISCDCATLSRLGFYPRGEKYWLFKLGEKVIDKTLISFILGQVDDLKKHPQILLVNKNKE